MTDLCMLGIKYPTDKSPYNQEQGLHKHAYTAIYDLLFSHRRYDDLILGEIGILDNNSMLSWREYFPNAVLHGFEYSQERLSKALNDNLPNTYYHFMDVLHKDSIRNGLSIFTGFDIIIEALKAKNDEQVIEILTKEF